MKFYEITYIIEDEQQERLSALAERYEKVNGWNEKEILQFAVAATSKEEMESKLQFLENEIVKMEKDWQEQEEKPKEKRKYISDEEHEKCKRVVSAYEKELDEIEVTVVDAGRFGFVKLIYYKFPYGFDDAIAYTDRLELFLDLWDEWFEAQLLALTKNTPMAELDYEDIFKCLSKDTQEELMAKREYFAEKAGIGARYSRKGQRLMRIADNGSCKEMYQYIKKIKHKVMFKIKLWEMDRLWELMGGSCWGLFPPSFYYTHTEEEIERITKETIESCKKMLDEF